jgi:hypothetical protein
MLVPASLWDRIRARGDVVASPAPEHVEDLKFRLCLVASGEITVVQDSTHELEDIAEAYRVETGDKLGNVVVRPRADTQEAST